jgi:CheY-like chemotaxis protein
MPVMDGWGFLSERRKDPRLMSVPVIVISATPEIETRAKAAGAHFTKVALISSPSIIT